MPNIRRALPACRVALNYHIFGAENGVGRERRATSLATRCAVAQANAQGLAARRKSDGAAAAARKSGLGHDGPPCGIRRFPARSKVQPP